jgi:hypothetical protein
MTSLGHSSLWSGFRVPHPDYEQARELYTRAIELEDRGDYKHRYVRKQQEPDVTAGVIRVSLEAAIPGIFLADRVAVCPPSTGWRDDPVLSRSPGVEAKCGNVGRNRRADSLLPIDSGPVCRRQ